MEIERLMDKDDLVVVTGGGGFIGGHLVADLRSRGYKRMRSVDLKPIDEWYQVVPGVENVQADLQDKDACDRAARDARFIFNLAADMGGMGFIETHKAECMLSVLINTNMLRASRDARRRALFLLLLGVRVRGRQADERERHGAEGGGRLSRHARGRLRLGEALQRTHVPAFPGGLRPADARCALSQRLRSARHLRRRAREGAGRDLPEGDRGDQARRGHAIEIWGDGEQTRSFMYIDDCLIGTQRDHGERRRRAAQSRQRRARDHQSAGRHRRATSPA